MSEAYDHALRQEVLRVADERGIPLRQGVYIGVTGPSFETPAVIPRLARMMDS